MAILNALALSASAANAPLNVQLEGRSVRMGNTCADMDFGILSVPSAVSLVVRPGVSDQLSQGTRIRLKSLDFGYQPDAHGATHARKIELSSNSEKYVSRPVDLNMYDKICCTDGRSAERLVYSFEDANCTLVVGTPYSISFLDECGREMERVRYKVVPDADSLVDSVSFSSRNRTYRPLLQLVGEVAAQKTVAESGPARSTGSIKVKTIPAEVRVLLDGRFAGKTQPSSLDDGSSRALLIDKVPEGEHTLLMQHSGYEDMSVSVKVVRGKTAIVNRRIRRVFEPDVEILSNGGSYRGVLVSKTSDFVMIETKPGVQRCFPTADVKKIVMLGANAK